MQQSRPTTPPPTSPELQAVLEAALEPIVVAQDAKIRYANPAAELLLGYTRAELAAREFVTFVHDEDRATVLDRHVRRLRGEDVPARYAFRVIDRSGAAKWVEIKPVVTTWAGRPATFNFLRDVSEVRAMEAEKQRLEHQLEEAHRLEALGALAGGVAHDMNNVLAAVLAFASTIQGEGGVDAAHAEDLEGIVAACGRGRDICSGLLGVAHRGTYDKRAIDVGAVVRDVERILKHTVNKSIGIVVADDARPAVIEADRTQLVNAILNLCVNAAQAMPDGGELRLRLGGTVVEPNEHDLLAKGRYVSLEVADTGIGMDAETKRRALEPFFTTKPLGQGSGLGLSMAYGLARSHGGTLAVASEPGIGTTVTMLLPESTRLPAARSSRPVPASSAGLQAGAVLVVDDESLVRRATERLLRRLGRKAVVAEGAREAFDAYLRAREKIAVAVIDLMMPGMSGFELFRRLRAAMPALPVVIASGGSPEAEVANILAEPRTTLLRKPFDGDSLAAALAQVEAVDA